MKLTRRNGLNHKKTAKLENGNFTTYRYLQKRTDSRMRLTASCHASILKYHVCRKQANTHEGCRYNHYSRCCGRYLRLGMGVWEWKEKNKMRVALHKLVRMDVLEPRGKSQLSTSEHAHSSGRKLPPNVSNSSFGSGIV